MNVTAATIVPNPNSPLSLTVALDTDNAGDPVVEVQGPDGTWTVPATGRLTAQPALHHEVMVLGLREGASYMIEVAATNARGETGSSVVLSHTTESLPLSLPVDVVVGDFDRMEPGVTLFSVVAGPYGPALYGIDPEGHVIWYRQGAYVDVRRMSTGNLMACWRDNQLNTAIVELDMLGNEVRRLSDSGTGSNGFHHECFEMPNGNLLTLGRELRDIGGYPPDGETYHVVGDVIMELTWDGDIVNAVSLFDVLDPYRVLADFHHGFNDELFGVPTKNWTHTNGVIYDPGDDTYILSVRHQDAVIKVSRDGQLRWVLGQDVPDTTGDDDWPFLSFVGQGVYTNHQHAPQLTPAGSLMVYDNANASRQTRAVEFDIDEEALTVRQLWEWRDPAVDPPVFAHFVGDADYLSGGTVLVAHAGRNVDPAILDSATAYMHMVEVVRASDEKVWEVVIRDTSAEPVSTRGYRAERLADLYPPE